MSSNIFIILRFILQSSYVLLLYVNGFLLNHKKITIDNFLRLCVNDSNPVTLQLLTKRYFFKFYKCL